MEPLTALEKGRKAVLAEALRPLALSHDLVARVMILVIMVAYMNHSLLAAPCQHLALMVLALQLYSG